MKDYSKTEEKMIRKEPKKRIDCFKCKHFYITWDVKFPKGCEAVGFKTKYFPSDDVYRNSGMNCQYFEKKPGS